MKKVQLTETIKAPKEKVWQTLWDKETYGQWTKVFSEGSYMVTDWKEGSRVHFLGNEGGMYSTIERIVPNELVTFKHIGEVKNGEEQPLTEESKKWSGITESYFLKENNGQTELTVEFDATDESEGYFMNAFPKALAIVKELAEQKA